MHHQHVLIAIFKVTLELSAQRPKVALCRILIQFTLLLWRNCPKSRVGPGRARSSLGCAAYRWNTL